MRQFMDVRNVQIVPKIGISGQKFENLPLQILIAATTDNISARNIYRIGLKSCVGPVS